MRLLDDDVPQVLAGRRDLQPRHGRAARRHAVPRRLRGAVQGGARRAASARRLPILFIDEIHATIGAGATTGGTMDLATLIKPVLTAGELRVVGSTTFEEFKQIEKDRALARRLQKVVVEEPTIEETVRILQGLRSRYEEHHQVDVHGRGARGGGEAGQAPPARLPPARQRDRHPRRGRRDAPAAGAAAGRAADARRTDGGGAPTPPGTPGTRSSGSSRGWRASPRSRPPRRTASACGRSRSRCAASSSARTRRCDMVAHGDQALARRPRRSPIGRPAASSSPDRPASARPSWRKQLALHLGNEFLRYDMSEYMEKHAVSRLIGAPPGYVGLRAGRPAGGRRAARTRTPSCCSTRSRRRTRTSSTSCCR